MVIFSMLQATDVSGNICIIPFRFALGKTEGLLREEMIMEWKCGSSSSVRWNGSEILNGLLLDETNKLRQEKAVLMRENRDLKDGSPDTKRRKKVG